MRNQEGRGRTTQATRTLTLDSNILIAAVKTNESYSEKCAEIVREVPDQFVLSEPSIVYQEVCGTLARRAGVDIADQARKQLDLIIHPSLVVNCDRAFCISAYSLCSEYHIYAVDAAYLRVALDHHAVLVSLDKEDFTDRVNSKRPSIEAYHASEFPY